MTPILAWVATALTRTIRIRGLPRSPGGTTGDVGVQSVSYCKGCDDDLKHGWPLDKRHMRDTIQSTPTLVAMRKEYKIVTHSPRDSRLPTRRKWRKPRESISLLNVQQDHKSRNLENDTDEGSIGIDMHQSHEETIEKDSEQF